MECNRGIREHLDMGAKIEKEIVYMDYPEVTEGQVKKHLKKLKKGKAAGPDGMKPEFYKALEESPVFIKAMKGAVNKITDEEDPPPDWEESNTTMIPKTSKPKVKDLRPIAVTNVSYKLYMNMAVKDKIEEHIVENELIKETQSGFTDKGRIENNLMILKYCIDSTFLNKLPLIVISIDFSKAYDSLKRGNLIETLKEFKIHERIIGIIKKIYSGDWTNIDMGDKKIEMKVSSGIRQGCTASTTLFKLVTYKIIEMLEKEGKGFVDEALKISALFFADEGLVLTKSVKEAEELIKLLIEIGDISGLQINKDKSIHNISIPRIMVQDNEREES